MRVVPAPSPPLLQRTAAAGRRALLPDAEVAEDLPEQLVGTEGSGDAAQCVVGQSQLLGQKIERGIGAIRQQQRLVQMLTGGLKRLHVACAGDEHAIGLRVPAGQFEQFQAQRA